MSLGRAWLHRLDHKLDQAQKYGFQGIELFYEDLEYYTKEHRPATLPNDLVAAAASIRQLCEDRNLTIVSLGPFAHCEGLRDPEARKRMLEKLGLWISLAHALGTKIIQIPSNFLSKDETTGNIDNIIRDLTEVAEIGLQQSVIQHFFDVTSR